MTATVLHGDCLGVLKTLPDASVDAVVTDPPYPHIKRSYGEWTEAEWWALIVEGVIPQVRRVLKPTGSAVFILQPNSRKVGSMRGWLFRFQAWACEHWNMVQDAYWWNVSALPSVHCHSEIGLMRPSLKMAVWLGSENCYRDQNSVLWDQGRIASAASLCDRALHRRSSGWTMRNARALETATKRGGVTPFNVLPWAANGGNGTKGGEHGAGTPLALARWWTRYLCPPGGTVLDPFLGSGTMALAALKEGRQAIGIERDAGYVEIARRWIAEAEAETPLFAEGQP
jgi:DNA modification methylase